ncbi:MAG: hypothetical protein Q7T55_00285 [Solirubrobacteraceae bacterium]|nr:hypothetical protein [Solirubrobacteraceae bacterium]
MAAAFESWHPFTPYYRKTGDLIVVEVNLKDNVWYGSAKRKPGGPKSDAYWEALVEATKSWRRDVWSVIGDTDEFGLDD